MNIFYSRRHFYEFGGKGFDKYLQIRCMFFIKVKPDTCYFDIKEDAVNINRVQIKKFHGASECEVAFIGKGHGQESRHVVFTASPNKVRITENVCQFVEDFVDNGLLRNGI